MPDLELSIFGARAAVGTRGEITLRGHGVLARHAELFAGSDGSTWVRPLDGDVWIERKGMRELVTRPRRLADVDVIIVGDQRITYRNLLALKERSTGGRASWMR